ncbi:MAG: hypothetical protein NC405_06475 [Odoribacter sp.]|nr:hypothetical protein [Odoribacter sp.]
MKKLVLFITLSATLLSGGCTEESKDSPIPPAVEEPSQPVYSPDELGKYANLDPLPALKSIDLTAAEQSSMNALTDLAFSLAPKIPANEEGNVIFSPASLVICLNLYINSIDAPFSTNVAHALGFEDMEAMSSMSKKLMAYLPSGSEDIKVTVANSIWHTASFRVSDSYKTSIEEQYRVPVTPLDFSARENAIKIINAWASDNTGGLITDLIEDLREDAIAVWANALFFDGKWEIPFDSEITMPEPFNGLDKKSTVETMRRPGTMLYTRSDDFTYVGLPFKKNAYYFDLIIGEPEATLGAEEYANLTASATPQSVALQLPAFKASLRTDFTTVIDGLTDAAASATLTTMGLPADVRLTNNVLIQSSTINVNEEGAIAAAATAMTSEMAAPGELITVRFDSPFYYAIRETTTGAIVFFGKINNL